VFCCGPYVQVSEVCMSGLCRPVHPVRACLGKFLARCRTGVGKSPGVVGFRDLGLTVLDLWPGVSLPVLGGPSRSGQ